MQNAGQVSSRDTLALAFSPGRILVGTNISCRQAASAWFNESSALKTELQPSTANNESADHHPPESLKPSCGAGRRGLSANPQPFYFATFPGIGFEMSQRRANIFRALAGGETGTTPTSAWAAHDWEPFLLYFPPELDKGAPSSPPRPKDWDTGPKQNATGLRDTATILKAPGLAKC
ncbi:hypothetical protein BX600DRAFT_435033 [Xylariales sp. PMI_506]|nr:hypothetical protein BX600DRAFT_435033 [Xylariales sp. PMI_506]